MPLTPEDYQRAINTYQGISPTLPAGAAQDVPVMDPTAAPVMAVAPAQAPSVAAPSPVVAAPQAADIPAEPVATNATVQAPAPVAVAPAAEPPKAPTFDQSITDYKQAAQHEAEAVRQGAEIDAKAIEDQGKVAQAQADEIAAQHAQFKKEQEEYAKVRTETLEEFKTLNRQAENMRAVDQRSTTQRVMGTVGIALGAVADGFARMGGNNHTNYTGEVQAQIQNQIDRDLERQRQAIDDKKKSAANRLTELGLARNFFGDSMDAMKFADAQISLKYASQLKAVAAKTSNDAARNAAEQTAAALESKSAVTIAQLVEKRDEQKMKSRLAGGAAAGGGGKFNAQDLLRRLDAGEPMSKQELDYALKLDAARARDTSNETKKATNDAKNAPKGTLIPGYEALDESAQSLAPGDVHKAREIASGVEGIRSAGNRLASLYSDIEKAEASGNSDKANELRARYYTAGGQFLVQKSLAGGQGVINEADARRDAQEGAVPPPPGAPASLMSKFTQAYKGVSPSADGIRALANDITSDGVSKLKVYNLRPAGAAEPFKPINQVTTLPDGAGATPDVKIRVRNLETGAIGTIPANKLDAALKSGKFQRE